MQTKTTIKITREEPEGLDLVLELAKRIEEIFNTVPERYEFWKLDVKREPDSRTVTLTYADREY